MARIDDHEYLKLCAKLASFLSVSIAAAKKKIDLACASKGVTDISSRKEIAEKLLKEAQSNSLKPENSTTNKLDNLLEALAGEDNFMVED